MTMIKITRDDGGVSIMRLVEGDAETAIKNWEDGGYTAVSWQEIDPSTVPQDRTFRNAWAPDLSVDMTKARVIHMDRIRLVRNERLAALDIETMMALSNPGRLAAIEARKQALRDLPDTLDLSNAATPDDLKAVWPSELDAKAIADRLDPPP